MKIQFDNLIDSNTGKVLEIEISDEVYRNHSDGWNDISAKAEESAKELLSLLNNKG